MGPPDLSGRASQVVRRSEVGGEGMATKTLRIGIAGCGHAARVHLGRLTALDGVHVVGLADPDLDAARALATTVGDAEPVPAFADHRELIRQATPAALATFT